MLHHREPRAAAGHADTQADAQALELAPERAAPPGHRDELRRVQARANGPLPPPVEHQQLDAAELVRLCQAGSVADALARLGALTPAQRADLAETLRREGRLLGLPVPVQASLQPEATHREFVRQDDGFYDGRFSCETSVRIAGSSFAAVRAALLGDWGAWFGGARVSDVGARGQQGGMRFHFEPVLDSHGKSAFSADVTIGEPVALGPGHHRFPMTLRGDLVGDDLYIDVQEVDGGFIVRSRWNGVRENTPFPSKLVGLLHTMTEAGTLRLPGVPTLDHRGYLGLVALLSGS